MSAYLDTSLVVAALANEPRSEDVRAWLDAQAVGDIVISDWTITEVSSTLALKLRAGTITASDRAKALAAFRKLVEESFTVVSVAGPTFRTAAAFADRADLGLRAGDALHVAVAIEHGVTLWTLDKTQAEAGSAVGATTALL